jgi:predicted neuraminidase
MVISPETLPSLATLPPDRFERVFVFGEARPFAQCHAATLVERRDGTTLVAFFAGPYEGHDDVAIWIAERPAADPRTDPSAGSATRFGAPRIAAKVAPVAHWNPVLYPLGGEAGEAAETEAPEPIALQWKVGRRIRRWTTWLARSYDGGRTFEDPAPLVPGDRSGGRGAVRSKPIRLASGDWLAGASRETRWRWDAFFDRSPDGIGGWVASAPIALDRSRFQGKGLIQPALWESAPGRVHALLRSTDGRIHRSDSEDDGRTWSTARAIDVPNNNSALDVARLADGTLALACNPVPGNWGPRSPLSLLFSRDEGASWPWRIDVETGPGEFSYPALIASGGGLALCYTWNRRRIAYLRIPDLAGVFAAWPGG